MVNMVPEVFNKVASLFKKDKKDDSVKENIVGAEIPDDTDKE